MASGVIFLMYLASRLLALALLPGHLRLDQAPVKDLVVKDFLTGFLNP